MATRGIYRIKNKHNGKFYLGSSDNIQRRFSRHLNDLCKNKHDNAHLQRSWNKHGSDAFTLEMEKIMKFMGEESCREFDMYFIRILTEMKT